MIASQLSRLEREMTQMVGRLRALEEIDVPSAAKLLKKKPSWVRANLPIIVHGPRSSRVRLVDIEAFQERRTVRPKLSPGEFESVFAGKRLPKFRKHAA